MATDTPTLEKPARAYRGIGVEQRKAERRERFIQAAVERFGSDGYHASTLKSLCAEAGLTERYFYESFENFDALLCCSYQASAAQVQAVVARAISQAGTHPAERVRAAMTAYFKAIAANPARARLILIEIEGASDNANQLYRAQLRLSAEQIRVDILGGLPDVPGQTLSPQLLTMGLLGAVYQLAKEWTLSNFKQPRAALVRNVEAIFAGVVAQWAAAATGAETPES